MREISINGLTLKFDDNVELSIEGNKVTIKGAAPESAMIGAPVVHEHHYHQHYTQNPITVGPPYFLPNWGTLGTNSLSLPNSGDVPPPTSGYVQVIDTPPAGLSGGAAVMFQAGNDRIQVSDNLARFL